MFIFTHYNNRPINTEIGIYYTGTLVLSCIGLGYIFLKILDLMCRMA